MNAISMLRKDHRKVEKLLREFETAGARAFRRRQQIVRKLCTEVEIHNQLEEQLFYPAVQLTADPKGRDFVRAAITEHHVVQSLIDTLNSMSSESAEYDPTFKRLAKHVERQIEKEEHEILPDAREQLGPEQLDYLGDQMLKRRRELTPERPYLLRDTVRQVTSFVSMAYDALTGAEVATAPPPVRRRAKSAPTRRMPRQKQVIHAKAKRRAQSAHLR